MGVGGMVLLFGVFGAAFLPPRAPRWSCPSSAAEPLTEA